MLTALGSVLVLTIRFYSTPQVQRVRYLRGATPSSLACAVACARAEIVVANWSSLVS